MIHAEADWVQALGGRWSLHLSSSNELREQTVVSGTAGDETSFERGSLFAGVDLASAFGLTFELGFDTEKPEDTARNLFNAGHLVAHFTDWHDLRATGGTQRGGIKCISGVCRDLPEFAGGRAEVVARF